jgi:hypothetical protein
VEHRHGIRVALGHNAFDLFLQYQGHASGGDGSSPYVTAEQAMAKKRMFDARNEGAAFLRVSVTGWNPIAYNTPGDLTLWQVNPTAYWALMDQMMNDLDSYQLKIVPMFLVNLYQFPAMGGDTMLALITNPNSNSYGLLKSYITHFVTRYQNRPTIAFYELTNELNLSADMDSVGYCLNSLQWAPSSCAIASNFTTAQMIAFTSGLTAYVKSLDPGHMIESGYALPRPAAQHLRANPVFGPNGPDWTPDTPAQLQQNMDDIHQGFDIMSVHFYNTVDQNSGLADTQRFGITNPDDASLLVTLKQIADGAGKPLHIGEWGDDDSASGHDSPFSANVLAEIQNLAIPFSSPWIMEFYQSNTYTSTFQNIDPGYTNSFIAKYENTNLALGNPVALEANTPQVVLTWPLNGSVLAASQSLYAVASTGSSGSISYVWFNVDGAWMGYASSPSYAYTIDTSSLAPGAHTISAYAFNNNNDWNTGDWAQSSITVNK